MVTRKTAKPANPAPSVKVRPAAAKPAPNSMPRAPAKTAKASKTVTPRTLKTRPAQAGDTGPTSGAARIEAHTISEAVDAAQEARLAAMRDLVSGASEEEASSLLRNLLREKHLTLGEEAIHPDSELAPDWREGGYPYKNLMSRRNYEREKYRLQVELLKLQAWVKETGQKVVILFEGRDAAGKGGTIKRFMEHLNPRGAHVVALEKPTETERGQWYFQRYVQNLPTAGEIALFDRSWYNRAGVERVMGFCTQQEYLEFMRQCPEFERNLVRSGIHVIKSDCKKRARLNAMRYVLHRLPYGNKDPEHIGKLDPLIVGRANVVYERGEKQGVPIL